jgi:hypothetical protein
MSIYYESHVTVEPVFGERLELLKNLCEANEFRIADLLMQKREEDTPERSKFDTFCSARDVSVTKLMQRMLALVAMCQADGFKVWRYKIEDVILDSKFSDSLLPLK